MSVKTTTRQAQGQSRGRRWRVRFAKVGKVGDVEGGREIVAKAWQGRRGQQRRRGRGKDEGEWSWRRPRAGASTRRGKVR